MGLLDRRNPAGHIAQLEESLAAAETARDQAYDTIDLHEERLAELEFAIEDQGWDLLRSGADRELSRRSLDTLCKLASVAYLKNPLIRRAVRVRAFYVWGQGVQWSSPHEQTNELLADTADDRGNRTALFGHQARWDAEIDLALDGNLFAVLFTDPKTGRVRVRVVPLSEITDVVENPDDRTEPWFYKRTCQVQVLDVATGRTVTETRVVWHPALWYEPPARERPEEIGGAEVKWDAPIYHVKVGGRSSMRFGVPEVYAALDWAKAYKEFLEDWATLVRALSRFAFKLTTPGRKTTRAKERLQTTAGTGTTTVDSNPPATTGATFVQPTGTNLEAIPKTGATVSADDGRQLRLMVAAAMDLPDTVLSGDADQGNRATAQTLDRPTELAMLDRQSLWREFFQDVFTYIAAAAIRAGRLHGNVSVDGDDVAVEVEGEPLSISVDFPPILQPDIGGIVGAIVTAATLEGKTPAGTIPPQALARKLLTTLGFDNVDDLVGELERIAGDTPDPETVTDLADVAEAARKVLGVLDGQ